MRERKEQWSPTLVQDGLYEYTSTSDCDGSNVKWLCRRPEIKVAATEWVETTRERYMAAQEATICPACNGMGIVSDMHYDGSETTYECPDCHGSGTRSSSEGTR